jgi:hypothetical protein
VDFKCTHHGHPDPIDGKICTQAPKAIKFYRVGTQLYARCIDHLIFSLEWSTPSGDLTEEEYALALVEKVQES